MSAKQVRNLVLKQARVIALCCIAGVIGAIIGTRFMTPEYQSTVIMQAVLSPQTPNTYALLVLDRLIGTETQLAASTPVLNVVAKDMAVKGYPGLTSDNLKSKITATPEQNTQLFKIAVVDTDPQRAAVIANTVAAVLIDSERSTMELRNQKALQEVQQDLSTTLAEMQSTNAKLQDPNTTPSDASQLKAQLLALQLEYSQDLITQSQLQVQDGQYAILLMVQTAATPGVTPIRPLILVNVGVGLGCGLVFGVLLTLVFGQLDQQVRGSKEIETLLGWPVLADATIADASAPSDRKRSAPRGAPRGAPRESAVDNDNLYPTLQRAVEFLGIDHPVRTIALVGGQESDSAGVVAANWAALTAAQRRRTLLIDADLTRPMVAEYFGVSAQEGLSDATLALRQGESPTNVLKRALHLGGHGAMPPGLSVMTAGTPPPNPSQVMESQAMGLLFTALPSTGADLVIFHAPPVLGQLRASSLMAHVDGVVVVVEAHRARKDQLARLKARLIETQARVFGLVLVGEQAGQRVSWQQTVARASGGRQNPRPRGNQAGSLAVQNPAGPPLGGNRLQ